jgi:DNA adenine methylase
MVLRSPICYVGGKSRLVQVLLDHVPKHDTYVESFAGGASLFFAKQPVRKEVINDIDPELVKFYKTLINTNSVEKCERKPTEKSFYEVKEKKNKSLCDFYYFNQCSYACNKETYGWGKCEKSGGVSNIERAQKELPQIKEKLKHAVILNQDFEKVVDRYDSPKTFFYFDPPYYKVHDVYRKFSNFDINRLLNVCKKIKGKFLISLNDHPDVKKLFKKFHIKGIKTYFTIQHNSKNPEAKKLSKQLLIANYDLNDKNLGNPRPRYLKEMDDKKDETKNINPKKDYRKDELLDFTGVLLAGSGVAFIRKNPGLGAMGIGLGLIMLSRK